jgi:hypothetical protein
MTRISHNTPLKGFDHVASLMKEHAGRDGVLSRKDAQELVKSLRSEGRGTEALAADNLFKMLDKRDSGFSGARVTGRDLNSVKTFVKDKMLENRDVNNDGYSRAEIAKMSETGKALVEIGKMLEAGIIGGTAGDARSVARNLEKVAKNITFEGFAGNEGGDHYKAVSFDLPKSVALTGSAVHKALGLDPSIKLGRSSDYDVWEMVDYHLEDATGDFKKGYTELKKALKELSDVKMFVDSNEANVEGKVFIVGRLKDGSVAGLETTRIWT